MKEFEFDEVDLHISLAWNAVKSALEDPVVMKGIDYDTFCAIYRYKLMECISNIDRNMSNPSFMNEHDTIQ